MLQQTFSEQQRHKGQTIKGLFSASDGAFVREITENISDDRHILVSMSDIIIADKVKEGV